MRMVTVTMCPQWRSLKFGENFEVLLEKSYTRMVSIPVKILLGAEREA